MVSQIPDEMFYRAMRNFRQTDGFFFLSFKALHVAGRMHSSKRMSSQDLIFRNCQFGFLFRKWFDFYQYVFLYFYRVFQKFFVSKYEDFVFKVCF